MRRQYYGEIKINTKPPIQRRVHLYHELPPPVRIQLRDTHPVPDQPLRMHKYEGSPKQEILYESSIRKNNYGPHVGGSEAIAPAPQEPVISEEKKLEMEIKGEINRAIKAEKEVVQFTDINGKRVYEEALEHRLNDEEVSLWVSLFRRRKYSHHNHY